MAESIKEVIARMKANQQNSQASKPAPAPKPAKVEEVEQEQDDYIDEEEEMPEIEEKVAPKPVETTEKVDPSAIAEQQIAMEIELLQNDGRFRAELLHQMQEINKALVVIAGTLVDLAGKNGKN